MVHIYTGEGKGKTTAAIGLAVRASAHHKVLYVQFLKDGSSSEMDGLKMIPNIDIEVFGNGTWITGSINKEQEDLVQRGFDLLAQKSNEYDVVIADELITAASYKIISGDDIVKFIKAAPDEKEIILTGHDATKKMIDVADLVTEMKCIKHYYNNGIEARKGIEL